MPSNPSKYYTTTKKLQSFLLCACLAFVTNSFAEEESTGANVAQEYKMVQPNSNLNFQLDEARVQDVLQVQILSYELNNMEVEDRSESLEIGKVLENIKNKEVENGSGQWFYNNSNLNKTHILESTDFQIHVIEQDPKSPAAGTQQNVKINGNK